MARSGLGRGLNALFGDEVMEQQKSAQKNEETPKNAEFITVKLSLVEPNKDQPRKAFDEEALAALSDSIKQHGLLQPITVTEAESGFYKIVAGERRWRAARMAGLKEVPVHVVKLAKQQQLEVALIENLQRADLNPVEEAFGYKKLMEEFKLTQEQVSERVGKSRSAVANALRLLGLDAKILKLLEQGAISSGHARAVLSVSDEKLRAILAEKIVKESLSVREAETLSKNPERLSGAPAKKKKAQKAPHITELETKFSESLGTKVTLKPKKKGGTIEIEYYDNDQLDELIRKLAIKKKR